jgi:predicted AAA+ superfamily ATPase
MKRLILKNLTDWKDCENRKPLLLQGARQVGKTYVLEQFGREKFDRVHRFDFSEEPALKTVFELDLKPDRIIRDLGLYRNLDISIEHDLLIFDEIQQCPKALTSLKYFAEQMPHAYVCGSGSLLGVGLSDELFPVGKVSHLHLYPLNFREFLCGMGENRLEEAWLTISVKNPVSDIIHQKLWEYYKYYLITGGLPEVIVAFRQRFDRMNEAFEYVRTLQRGLVKDYLGDIAKHSGKLKSVRVDAVFQNIPIQLAKEIKTAKKFIFRDVLPTASRYSALEGPIEWLVKAGLIYKVMICNRADLPFKAYANEKRFKLYLFDVGILGAMLELSPKTIFDYEYGQYKGYFAENAVLTELTSRWDCSFYSWQSNTAEIEFMMDIDGEVVPIEVKAGINKKAKSLKVFRERYHPRLSLLLTANGILDMGAGRIHLPLYLAARFPTG